MVSRREFVRIVPVLGAFTVVRQVAEAQGGQEAWPPAPPAEGAHRDEAFPRPASISSKEIVGTPMATSFA